MTSAPNSNKRLAANGPGTLRASVTTFKPFNRIEINTPLFQLVAEIN